MHAWIASSAELDGFLGSASGAARMGLDTEFVRERTYHAQLALVQIAIDGRIGLVDPLALEHPEPLLQALRGPALKLMHSPSEDLQALAHHYGVVPAPFFDTQIAAALTGFGAGIGYQRLVESALGVTLQKGETRSDWLRRPLSESQQRYAAEDVLHLEALYQLLAERLDRLGRRGWLDEDCNRMLESAANVGIDPQPHLSMRPAQRMNAQAQARLRRLLLWREAEARATDKPRGWILDNDTALRLAERPPRDRGSFEEFLDSQPKAPRRKRDPLWDLLQQPLAGEDLDIPLATQTPETDKGALRALQEEVAAIAAEMELPEGLLCARRHLETLLLGGPWPLALCGWREQLLRSRLQARMP
jgi:ribonuclease D